MTETSDLLKVVKEILDEIDSQKSDLEYGYSWKQSLLKNLDIAATTKKKLGLWKED